MLSVPFNMFSRTSRLLARRLRSTSPESRRPQSQHLLLSQLVEHIGVGTTSEQHGIVPLHSKVLGDAIGRRVLLLRESEERRRVPKKDRFEAKMSKDQRFLCERTGLGMP
jgi:hypothetical protein